MIADKEDKMIADIMDGGQKTIYNMALSHVLTLIENNRDMAHVGSYERLVEKIKSLKK